MRNRLLCFILFLLQAWTGCLAQASTDSIAAKEIDRQAASEDFIHCYILLISEGRTIYSAFGHTAIRMVCPSKQLDYCFTFEMNIEESSYLDMYRRKAKAGFTCVPSQLFLDSYKKEGRGIISEELNLMPKEKQNLWKILDEETQKGSTWQFDYTSINCTSMTMYAIGKAIAPAEIKYKKMPVVVYEDLDEWTDYITEASPWARIGLHMILRDVDNTQAKPEDLLTPPMMKAVLPNVIISSSKGDRSLVKGKAKTLSKQTYTDKPFWFSPDMVLVILMILLLASAFILYKKKNKHAIHF